MVSSSDRLLDTCSTVRFALPAKRSTAEFGVSLRATGFACIPSCCKAARVETATWSSQRPSSSAVSWADALRSAGAASGGASPGTVPTV